MANLQVLVLMYNYAFMAIHVLHSVCNIQLLVSFIDLQPLQWIKHQNPYCDAN